MNKSNVKSKIFLTVLSYTIQENVKKKLFIISTIITVLITIGIVLVPTIIDKVSNDNQSKVSNVEKAKKQIVYIVDENNFLESDDKTISSMIKDYSFKFSKSKEIVKIKNDIKANEDGNISLLVVENKGGMPFLQYWVKKSRSGLNQEVLASVIKNVYSLKLLKSLKIEDTDAAKITSQVGINENELGKGFIGGIILSYIVAILLFFSIYMYGYGVAMSVASEKTSRVMELLITSTKPSIIILGKTVAMGILGLFQMILVIGSGALTYILTFPDDFVIDGMKLDISNFTPFAMIVLLVYFVLGYSLYALLNAVAGALVSKAEDVNSAIMPISMVTLIAFYIAYGSMFSPDSTAAVIASMVPFTSPFSMPCRILTTEVPSWQVLVSVLGLGLFIVASGWISIRIYSGAVLHYGKRLGFKDVLLNGFIKGDT